AGVVAQHHLRRLAAVQVRGAEAEARVTDRVGPERRLHQRADRQLSRRPLLRHARPPLARSASEVLMPRLRFGLTTSLACVSGYQPPPLAFRANSSRANFTPPPRITVSAHPRTCQPANGQLRLFERNLVGSIVHSTVGSITVTSATAPALSVPRSMPSTRAG